VDQTSNLQAELRRYAEAIKLAEQDGDREAADYLRMQQKQITAQIADLYRSEQGPGQPGSPTSGMGWGQRVAANLGAGLSELPYGVGQSVGLVSAEDYRDKAALDQQLADSTFGGSALQFAGATLPAVAVPFSGGLPGAAAFGAAYGALSPTTNDSIVLGKLGNTLLGAAGAPVGVVAGRALVPVGRAAGDFLARQGLRGPGARQRLAERALLDEVGDPAVAAAAIRRGLAREVPGVTPSTGQLANNREILQNERAILARQGTDASLALAEQSAANNRARWRALEKGLDIGSPRAIERGRQVQFQQDIAQWKLKPGGIDPNDWFRRFLTAQRRELAGAGPRARAAIDKLEAEWQLIRNLPTSQQLKAAHKFRRTGINDAITDAYAGDKGAQTVMRQPLRKIKRRLDQFVQNRMEAGDWKGTFANYERNSLRLAQAKKGRQLVDEIDTLAPKDLTGAPLLSGQRNKLGREMLEENLVDEWGAPSLSVPQRRAVRDVGRSLEVEARRDMVKPRDSGTAANLSNRLLGALDQRPLTWTDAVGALGPTGVGLGLGGGPGALIGAGAALGQRMLAHRAQRDIANRLVALYRDPRAALAVLERAVQSGQVPAAQALGIAQWLMSIPRGTATLPLRLGSALGAGAAVELGNALLVE
jgi:hypothetical protein